MSNYIFNFKCLNESINILIDKLSEHQKLLENDFLKNIISCGKNKKNISVCGINYFCYENITIPFDSHIVSSFFNNFNTDIDAIDKIKINDFFGLSTVASVLHTSYVNNLMENHYKFNTIDKVVSTLNQNSTYNFGIMSARDKDYLCDHYITFDTSENIYVNNKKDFDAIACSHINQTYGKDYIWFYLDCYGMNIDFMGFKKQTDYCKYMCSNYTLGKNENYLDVIQKVIQVKFFNLNEYIRISTYFSDEIDVKFIVTNFIENDISYVDIRNENRKKYNYNLNKNIPIIKDCKISSEFRPDDKYFLYENQDSLIILINKKLIKK